LTDNNHIIIHKLDESYLQIDSPEMYILKELVDYFTFKVPGAEFMPTYKKKIWDGNIRLFNPVDRKIYTGLKNKVIEFCNINGYGVVDSETPNPNTEFNKSDMGQLSSYISPKSKGKDIAYRGYQLDAIMHAINNSRAVLLSPTASGKSLIIYSIIRFFLLHPDLNGKKVLIIVPTTSLVSQMYGDFKDYGFNVEKSCHKVYQGQSKDTDKCVIISTWQSIYKLKREYYDQFGLVIGDECHSFKSNSLIKIMNNLVHCKYRFGTTGTLDGTHTHKLVLNGLFGDIKQITTTKKLIDSNTLSDFKIQCIVLKYKESQCKEVRKLKYHEELDWIISNKRRNIIISNLAQSLNGNTLILYNYVEKHGIPLHKLIKHNIKNKSIYFISGQVSADIREEIRLKVENNDTESIIIASYGTYSTGINIKNLHNIIFASPTKSRIRSLQSIGRALRKSDNNNISILYDIVDDLRYKKYVNFVCKHFYERLNIYNEEKFNFKINNMNIE
jgi:superfamily II DNA or RNA helicase